MKNNSNGKTGPSRRRFIKGGMLGSAAMLASSRIPLGFAQDAGEDLPRLSEEDPNAQALDYVHDAEDSEVRSDENEFCHNCQYFRGDESTPWAECQIFQGEAVAAEGWCSVWVERQ